MITMSVDFDPLIAGCELMKDQLPFAIARTLTSLAEDGQLAARAEEKSGIFNLRNDWTTQNTKIKPATKENPTSEVYTDTSNRLTGAPDYLIRQEDGFERVPVNGRKHMAVPTDLLWKMVGGKKKPIPDWLRPRNLLQLVEVKGKTYINRRGKEVRASSQTRGYYFFKVTFKSGATGIMCRALHDPPNAALPLYIFVTKANIRKRLHIDDDVDQAVNASLEVTWDRVWREVYTSEVVRRMGRG